MSSTIHPYSIPGVETVEMTEFEILEASGLTPVEKLQNKSRKRIIVEERQIYMYYLIKLFGFSSTVASAVFGKDHATALHAVKKIIALKEVDKPFLLQLRKIEIKIDNKYKNKMNYKQYFTIEKKLKEQGFDPERAELIHDFTNGKKDSLRALSVQEYMDFVDWLKRTFKIRGDSTNWQNTPENKMRRKLWSLFVFKMKYDEAQYKAWVITYGKFHKPIIQHTKDELVQLVSQAELVYQSWLVESRKGA